MITRAAERLAAVGVASPRHDAEVLLAYVLGVPKTKVASVDQLTAEQESCFLDLVRRRAVREPLQHLVGTAPFRYLELAVGPGVFIPRPETEVVAGWAIDAVRRLAADGLAAGVERRPVTVVDLGTGSGAIALSIATEVPEARVYAVELDPDAYVWAERNVAGTSVRLVQDDAAKVLPELDGTVDVVVANPPYIPPEAYESVEVEVRDYDPGLALWAEEEGLAGIRVVERAAARLLRSGGVVVCEHADIQGESAVGIFLGTGSENTGMFSDAPACWRDVRDHPDLAGRPRFVTAHRRGSNDRSAL